jgi:hypothetical protein
MLTHADAQVGICGIASWLETVRIRLMKTTRW